MALSDLMGILDQYRHPGAVTNPDAVGDHYNQVAQQVPQSELANGLTDAFRSHETPPFGQMLANLFGSSNGQQKAGILNQLLGSAGPGLLTSGALGSLAGMFGNGRAQVTPEQANQIPPEAVQQIAEHAEKQNPSVVEQAGQFYAQHPTLVQALGVGSMAFLLKRLANR